MLNNFWENVGAKIAGKWVDLILSPAYMFWAGGICLIVWREGPANTLNWLLGLDIYAQAAALIVGLIILTLSALLVTRLRSHIFRVLQGYWPWPLNSLGRWFTLLQSRRIDRWRVEWNKLKDKEEQASLAGPDRRRLSRLEVDLHYSPAENEDLLPTEFGNIIRAAERSSYYKYGLDALVCWPRLWLLLPENVRKELVDSREKLEDSVEFWAWGFLFLAWSFYTGWAVVISLIWMFFGSVFMREVACGFADLFEASFDLYRWELYKNIHWPLPENAGPSEITMGRRITEFLWRGTVNPP